MIFSTLSGVVIVVQSFWFLHFMYILLFHNVYISESIDRSTKFEIVTYFISSGLGLSTYSVV